MNKFKGFLSFMMSNLRNKFNNLFTVDSKNKSTGHSNEKTHIFNDGNSERFLTISQAAKKQGVTRQAIYFAIKMNRLKAIKSNDTWLIPSNALSEYSKTRYCRSQSKRDGKLIFDKSEGFFSINDAAKYLKKSPNHIYYLVRMGKLKTHRQGSAIVIKDSDLDAYAEFISKKSKKNLAA